MSINSSVNEKEIFDSFLRHEAPRKLHRSFDALLKRPLWWVSYKMLAKPHVLRQLIDSSYAICHDPRVKQKRLVEKILKSLKKRAKETNPYFFEIPGNGEGYCVPLVMEEKTFGFLILSGVKKNIRREIWDLLAGQAQLLVGNYAKTEEINRLSATIRPRAIALSTVHTVHRIINSTLNLEELVSRLAHLTAQVLRVRRCAIYLVDKDSSVADSSTAKRRKISSKPKMLIGKAFVGYPKGQTLGKWIRFGQGTEGQVAQTADIQLRKKYICVPLIDEDVIGVVSVFHKKDKKEFNYFDLEILTTLAEEAVIAIKNAQLYEEQRRVTLGTIRSLAGILGTRVPPNSVISPELFVRFALKVAAELRLSDEETQALHYATLLKETAKIGIPEEILRKSSKLTGEELSQLRDHPIKGARIVQHFESLKTVAPIILYSREKYDGSGYPEGLKGEAIPIGARILSVLNAFEAIIVGRPYRGQSSQSEALDEIVRNSGTQFDPRVVEAFMKAFPKK